MDIDPTKLASDHALAYLESQIRTIPDFPKEGIQFKDVTTLLADPRAFHITLDLLAQPFIGAPLKAVAAMEARGFIFGGALAARLNTAFVPVRKPGKLPAKVDEIAYSLEYGENVLQIHEDALEEGDAVLVVDDLLATGGTAAATAELIHRQGARVAGFAFVIELDALGGRAKLEQAAPEAAFHALVHVG